MRSKIAFSLAFMLATTPAIPSINRDWIHSAEADTLRAHEKGKSHAFCAADLALALRVQRGMDFEEQEKFEEAVKYHKDRAIILSGKEKFSAAFNEAYALRMEILEAAYKRSEIAFEETTKSYVREVYSCIGQMQSAKLTPER